MGVMRQVAGLPRVGTDLGLVTLRWVRVWRSVVWITVPVRARHEEGWLPAGACVCLSGIQGPLGRRIGRAGTRVRGERLRGPLEAQLDEARVIARLGRRDQ